MKQYTVYYIIKANRREWLHKMEVEAANSREAKWIFTQAGILEKSRKSSLRR